MKTIITFLILIITLVSFTSFEKEEIVEPQPEFERYEYADSISGYDLTYLAVEILHDNIDTSDINIITYNNKIKLGEYWHSGELSRQNINNKITIIKRAFMKRLYMVNTTPLDIPQEIKNEVKLKLSIVYHDIIVEEKIVNLNDILTSYNSGNSISIDLLNSNRPIFIMEEINYKEKIEEINEYLY